MDVRGVGEVGSKLFERIPDRLFSPLASPNRHEFWSLLCYLYRRRFGQDAPLPPSHGFMQRDILQDIEDHIRYAPKWRPEEGEEPDLSLDQRASNYFRRLLLAGWFRTERHGLAQTISMAPSVSQMLTLLIDYADKDPVFVSGKIHSIDTLITQVLKGDGGGDLFREAAEQCRNLLIYIRTTGTNVRDLVASIATQQTTAEYARKFFRECVFNMFIGDYKELRTQEHPLSKGGFEGAQDTWPQLFAPDGLMSASRLAQQRKETQCHPPSALRKVVLSEHTRAVGNLVRRAQERRRITPAKLRAYAKSALGLQDSVSSQDLPVGSIEDLRAYQSFNSLATALKSKIASSAMQARTQTPGLDVVHDEEGPSEHPFLVAQSFEIRLRKPSSANKKDSP